MTDAPTTVFASLTSEKTSKTRIEFVSEQNFAERVRLLDEETGGALSRAIEAARFKPKRKAVLDLLAPHGLQATRLLLVGLGGDPALTEKDWLDIGGLVRGKTPASATDIDAVIDAASADVVSSFALGFALRQYSFKKYKSNKKNESEDEDDVTRDDKKQPSRLTIFCENHDVVTRVFADNAGIAAGVYLGRDLVNEPANVLTPAEFANRLSGLEAEGLKIEVLDDDAMRRLGMNALLAVGQGSAQASYTVILRWDGAPGATAESLVLVGKGVCFDTGGISIKPAGGMEDMKGDMAGAAAVAGAMLAIARRKSPARVAGIVGLVENMPSATAQRPGDIVTSASGQTIEVINTDAEGRLVLADLLWYAQEHLKPKALVTLATLTGAILVALGKENAGLFANDDTLAANITEAGLQTGETVWRMPLSKKYNKMIDSKIADMKNIGGRDAGSITAAQFVQRFVNKGMPWAHLDIAGTAIGSPTTDTNAGWASGYGVRLLDRLCSKFHE